MGLVFANIQLLNGDDWSDFSRGRIPESEVRLMTVSMNIDFGALMLSINENIKNQLGLRTIEKRHAQLADGSYIELEIAGPVEVRFANRRCSVDAVVLPKSAQPLLGAIPMEDMDLMIHPAKQELVVHPDHPYSATLALRGWRY